MSEPYEEIVLGEAMLRFPPGERHETICARLHEAVSSSLLTVTTARLLPLRSIIQISSGTLVRPDLTLVTHATGKPWLIAEVVDSDDHTFDTVTKKSMYEEAKLPRLWMADLRYHNVEVYHGTPYGLSLKHILAGREFLTEALLRDLNLSIAELFAP